MWGSHLIKSSYYYSIVQQREREYKNQIHFPNTQSKQPCQILKSNFSPNQKVNAGKKIAKLHQCSSVFLGQNWPEEEVKSFPKQFGKNQSKERENMLWFSMVKTKFNLMSTMVNMPRKPRFMCPEMRPKEIELQPCKTQSNMVNIPSINYGQHCPKTLKFRPANYPRNLSFIHTCERERWSPICMNQSN